MATRIMSGMRPVWRLSVAVATLFALLPMSAGVAAQTDEDAAQRAAREISAARERANQAAEDFFDKESERGLIELERDRLVIELEDLEAEVDRLESDVEAIAVNRFVSSGTDGIPLLTDFRSPVDQVQADVLISVISETGATTLDDYEAARELLEDKHDELDDVERDLLDAQDRLKELQRVAEEEVERLRAIESDRLKDESVRKALEAQQAEQQRQLDELQRRQAAANLQSNPNPGVSAEAAAASSTGDLSTQGATSGVSAAAGSAAGGRTGGGGGGTNPRDSGIGYLDNIICPVVGPSAYGDTWGAPRSGGRRHQGVDMIAPTGTPLQAVVSGFIAHNSQALGGVTMSLVGDNGNRYYYGHLSAYEGEAGRVEQGQVIGYIGDTGNAIGIPHLHFEIHPNFGVAVNPTPSVRAAGC
jgi:murein DD-endopeptidase MepM/ murein hydrolase activator NlpD